MNPLVSFAFLLFVGEVNGHGAMVKPLSWFDAEGFGMKPGMMCKAGMHISPSKVCPKSKEESCGSNLHHPGEACFWYSNYTHIPGPPTLPDEFRTYAYVFPDKKYDFTYTHPWRAPGSARVFSACGTSGGNPYGCQGDCAAFTYPFGINAEDLTLERPVTQWKRGSSVEAAWGITANHGGGYAYRLCKIPPEGVNGVTEKCFQKLHLEFDGPIQWVQYGTNSSARVSFKATRVSEGTFPEGSTWTKNPIPGCQESDGGFFSKGAICEEEGGKTQFPPPAPGLFGFGVNKRNSIRPFQWSIVDKLKVPRDLELGMYVLSWRWDCEQTPQVWNTCATVEIVD